VARLRTWGRPLSIQEEREAPYAGELRTVGATVAVPLRQGERLVGILTLGDMRSGERYTQDDLALLITLANSTALALENARLHEERLAAMRRQLAESAAAQEDERQRIAQGLHDGIAPVLASLNTRLRTAGKVLDRDRDFVAGELDDMVGVTQEAIREVRRLIHYLRPAALDELGLAAALSNLVTRYERSEGLRVHLDVVEGHERLPVVVETALFRITQEALTNVVKHAQATHVEVALLWDSGHAVLSVVDNGMGFDPEGALSASGQQRQVGLWSIQQRVTQLQGVFDLDTAPGSGTALRITLPAGDRYG
jgi:signal transduction histidine kinase